MRFIAQDILSGEFLDWDLPLSGVQVTYALSGPTTIKASLTPEITSLVGTLQPWGTWVHAEDAGQIRASTILLPESFDDETATIAAESVSGYPHGMTYLGDYSKVNVDPVDVVREVWRHLQSYPHGGLGVAISDVRTPVRVGIELDNDGKPQPYALGWWDNKDCGQVIDDLAKATPFDYRDAPSWNPDKTAVLQKVEIGYPRLGRRRYELRFAQDENITSVVPVAETDDEYASDVLVVGAGEGRDAIRGFAAEPTPHRLRRVTVIVDQSITAKELANQLAKDELRRRQVALNAISQITVDARHDNAPVGSFQPGDDILVHAHLPWLGDVQWWHRITSYSHDVDAESVTVQLQRSETFRYGRDDVLVLDEWLMDDPVLSVMDLTTTVG